MADTEEALGEKRSFEITWDEYHRLSKLYEEEKRVELSKVTWFGFPLVKVRLLAGLPSLLWAAVMIPSAMVLQTGWWAGALSEGMPVAAEFKFDV